MLVLCDNCGAKYKITIKKKPGKSVTFKCGKCAHLIKIEQDKLEAPSGDKAPLGLEPPPEPRPRPEAKTVCENCGASFIKSSPDDPGLCKQCRIDSVVSRIKDKYGIKAAAPVAEPTEASRYTIRSADGLLLGPIRLRTVSVLAREKRIKGTEEVSKDDSEYQPLVSYPELAVFFPGLKEIMDTSGLEDKVEEAFMAVFGEEPAPEPAAFAETREPSAPEPPASVETSPPDEEPAPAEDLEPPVEPPESEPPKQVDLAIEPSPPSEPIEEKPPEATPEEAAPDDMEIDLEDVGSLEQTPPPQSPEPPAPREEKAPEPVPPGDEAETKESDEDAIFSADDLGAIGTKSPEPEPELVKEPEPPEPEPEKEEKPEEVKAPEPAEPVGTEFEVGEEWDIESEGERPEEDEEEIIEDLEPLPEPPPDARYRIRFPDGLMLGPVKLAAIKELYETGNLTGSEEVQREDEDWVNFTDLPELEELLTPSGEEEEPEEDIIELTEVLEEP